MWRTVAVASRSHEDARGHKVFLGLVDGDRRRPMGHRVIGVLPFLHINALVAWKHQRARGRSRAVKNRDDLGARASPGGWSATCCCAMARRCGCRLRRRRISTTSRSSTTACRRRAGTCAFTAVGGPTSPRVRAAEAGGVDRVALIARHDGPVVAVAGFDGLREPRAAEVAFAVADDWQRRGAGTRMLEQLAEIAAERGINRFDAEVMLRQPGDAGRVRGRRLRRAAPGLVR